ncbi:MAG: hypothetical protein DCC71_12255 [Proteobacteria bacterium]|nr:MAG: hypothetical protein DCC71_12255 [Pseudomonadota bacterium]
MRTPEELERFLAERIAPALRDVERERAEVAARREAVKLAAPWKIAAGAAGIAAGAWSGDLEPMLLVAALPWLVDAVRIAAIRDTATPRIRAELLRPLVEFFDPSFRYVPEGHVGREEFTRSRLFEGVAWNRYAGEDLVTGRHGATAFRFSEVDVERVTKRGKRRERERVFRGLVFVADCNKAFRGQTLVLPDRAERALGALGRALQSIAGGGGLSLVELEDPDFERAFVVRASDPTEARYLLSPSLMQRILAFHRNTGSQLRLSFTAGRVYVAVPLAHDLFATPLDARVGLAHVRAWAGELLFALGIVDELDLNTRIWSKADAT